MQMFSFFATIDKLQIFTYCFFWYKEKGYDYEHSRFYASVIFEIGVEYWMVFLVAADFCILRSFQAISNIYLFLS